MKKITILLLSLYCTASVYTQQRDIDTLKILLRSEQRDSVRIRLLLEAGNSFGYGNKKNDSVFFFLQEALTIANKINDKPAASQAKTIMSRYFYTNGNFKEALELIFQNLEFARDTRDTNLILRIHKDLLKTYREMDDYQQELEYSGKFKDILEAWSLVRGKNTDAYDFIYNNNLAEAYKGLGKFDSALFYAQANYNLYKNSEWKDIALSSVNLANAYANMGMDDSAYYFYNKCLSLAAKSSRNDVTSTAKLGLAKYFHRKGIADSAFFYAGQALSEFQMMDEQSDLLKVYLLLADLNRDSSRYDSAYTYLQRYVTLNDSLFNSQKIVQAQSFAYAETMEQQKIEQAKMEAERQYRNRIKFYLLTATMVVFLVIAFLLFRNLRNKRRANDLLNRQNAEIESALSELKSTQAQLIQSEKMASLGELTAGIAHEIQNPLNFVNNFSEVNSELIEEQKEELEKGNIIEAKNLANEIAENEKKINHHGQRADAIVKGMLQHSRSSSGQKEPTDINALCEEYLRLAYHGLKARDKSFEAAFHFEPDATLPKVNVVPQDIGRVMLNLINNAFQAVSEKQKAAGANYIPEVKVTTKLIFRPTGEGRGAEVIVADNGPGIPDNIKEKIFHPFFTTKPTGQGTGLGLSLSYDIVKAHGGEIKVETKENEGLPAGQAGTWFIILIPIS